MPPSFPTLAGWEDVFHEILSHLRPSEYFVFDDDEEVAARFFLRRTLLSLAVSCHAFLDPALDMLWHSLDNIHPLLRLLPNYQRRHSTYHLAGDIPPEAWLRLKTYATRVRSVTFSRKVGIAASVWRTICEQCEGTPLCPNLRKLHTIKLNATHISALRAFASPSLRDVFLEFYEDLGGDQNTTNAVGPAAGLVLQKFSAKAPGLLRLCFTPDMGVEREYLMCLSLFTQLEELYLDDRLTFDEDLLAVLHSPKTLTHLKMTILLRDPPWPSPLDLPDEFPKLTELDLCGPPAHLARFMTACSMPRLNNLSIWVGNHLPDGLETALASICRHIGPRTLTHFTAQLNSFMFAPRFLVHLLEPFLPFAHLEEVVFRLEDYLPLRDEDLARIAHAWPDLHILLFIQSSVALSDPDREPGSVERPTLAGLVELARGCPHLAELCIPELDASGSTAQLHVDSVPLMGHGPLDLCIQNLVGAEDEETQLRVAVVLDRLFPRLELEDGIEALQQYGGNANPHQAESKNVSKLLRAMEIGREHYPHGVERRA